MYYHFSNKKIKKLFDVDQSKSFMKPQGLWYATDDDWISFQLSNDTKHKYKYKYEVDVNYTTINKPDKNKILLIKNNKAYNLFLQKYCSLDDTTDRRWIFNTNWFDVSKSYGGIELKNLHKLKISKDTLTFFNLDKNLQFYTQISFYKPDIVHIYPDIMFFDIDSGCVWNIKALKKINLIKQ